MSAAHKYDWSDSAELVAGIARGDAAAMERLYELFSTNIRHFVKGAFRSYVRQWSGDVDDWIHDAYLEVVKEIRRGRLRHPERLQSFCMQVTRFNGYARKTKAAAFDRFADSDTLLAIAAPSRSPLLLLMAQERNEAVIKAINSLRPRAREIVIRFYFRGQSRETVCREMQLQHKSFDNDKWRALDRLAERTSRILNRQCGHPRI